MLELKAENAQGILMAADYLSISHIRSECELFMSKNLDVDNVCDVLRFAINYSFQILHEESLDFLCRNLESVSKTDSFLEFDLDFLVKFFESDNLVLYEGTGILKNVDNIDTLVISKVSAPSAP